MSDTYGVLVCFQQLKSRKRSICIYSDNLAPVDPVYSNIALRGKRGYHSIGNRINTSVPGHLAAIVYHYCAYGWGGA